MMMMDPQSGMPADSGDGEEWAYPVNDRQRALYAALECIAEEHGPFDRTTGPDGAHYVAPSPFAADGLVCSSCLFYDGARSCEIVAGDIDPAGVCKFWVIPADLIGGQQRSRPVQLTEIRRAVPVDSRGRERYWTRIESRAVEQTADGVRIAGLASVFNQRTRIRMPDGRVVLEEVTSTAFDNTLQRQDIFLLWQHDMATPLARTGAGNLTLRKTDAGLEYEATLPDTQAARDAAELVRRGIVNKMSFGFTVPDRGDVMTVDEQTGLPLRSLVDVRLWEVSLVSTPAYNGTSAAVRSDAFARLCRSLGVEERALLERLETCDDVRETLGDMLGASAAALRAVPGAGTTPDDAKRAGTTAGAGALDTHTWALRFATLG